MSFLLIRILINQILFRHGEGSMEYGAVAVGATIYFGSEQSRRQLVEIADAFEYAHELGMATVLWCYLRNSSFKKGWHRLFRGSRFDRTG